jgi:hypothetical protein
MAVSVRPRTKLLAALLAAGVVGATPAVIVPDHDDSLPAVSTAAVRSASVVTDILYTLGDVVNSGANATVIAVDAALG